MVTMRAYHRRRHMLRSMFVVMAAGIIAAGAANAVYAGEWKKDHHGWWYEKEDGSFPKSSWQWISSKNDEVYEQYYFDDKGYCRTNTEIDGKKVNGNGAWIDQGAVHQKNHHEFTGWNDVDGKHVFFNQGGVLLKDIITPDNIYVNQYGDSITESGIDPEEMAEKSREKTYIVVAKGTHFLELWKNGCKVRSYVISAGILDGDKEIEGDYKTPEGDFYLCKKVPNSAYHLGLGISYPDADDAERGFQQGIINEATYLQIRQQNEAGLTPNWYTPLGGEVEIHGNRQDADSTRGCIGMRNEDIAELYPEVNVGDRILILP